MTGKSPAELMFGRQIPTKLPRIMPKAQGKVAEEVRKTHKEVRKKQKIMQMPRGAPRRRRWR